MMKYAVCIVPVAHVRLEPDHRSEMTNQILFGETVELIETNSEGWIYASNRSDGYKGWCRLNQFMKMETALPADTKFTGSWVNPFTWNGEKLMLPFGTGLSMLAENNKLGASSYTGKIIDAFETVFNEENIREFSGVCMNTAYLWGGRSVFGIDCSGFVQTIFKLFNIQLLRDAKDQVSQGTEVGFLQLAQCGDVAFFDDPEGKIVHVGILLNAFEIVHASGNVRIDKIDHEGIIHSGTGVRTHRLRIIKRMV